MFYMTGGGASHKFIQAYTEKYLLEMHGLLPCAPERPVPYAVSYGGLMLYLEEEVACLPETIHFYITRGEFDESETIQLFDNNGDEQDRPQKLWRLFSIEPADSSRPRQPRILPMVFQVPKPLARLRVPLYASKHLIKDGRSLRDVAYNGPQQLEQWPIVFTNIDLNHEPKIEPDSRTDGQLCYTLKCTVQMTQEDRHLKVRMKVLGPEYDFKYKPGTLP